MMSESQSGDVHLPCATRWKRLNKTYSFPKGEEFPVYPVSPDGYYRIYPEEVCCLGLRVYRQAHQISGACSGSLSHWIQDFPANPVEGTWATAI